MIRRYRWVIKSDVDRFLELYDSGLGYTRIGRITGFPATTVGKHIRKHRDEAERRKRGYPKGLKRTQESS
jgi:hypothetical protein